MKKQRIDLYNPMKVSTWFIWAIAIIIAIVQTILEAPRNTKAEPEVDPIVQDQIDALDNLITALDFERKGCLRTANREDISVEKREKLITRAASLEVRITKLTEQVLKKREAL